MKLPARSFSSGCRSSKMLPARAGIFTFFLLCFSFTLTAQDKVPVSGTVLDSAGKAIQGVTVSEKGTQNITATNESGIFSIQVNGASSVLVFTYVGHTPKEIRVGNQKNITVSLQSANADLGEVVVVGYGSRKKESLTGAISTVTSKDLERVHGGSTVSSGLAGKLPGVTFRMPDGRPGASASIQIRNMGDPLYVIDGIQQDAGQFNNLAPNDVESITVLKDASAAIYGVRAANGVVVVTTKRGKVGSRNTINIDAYTGWQNWSRFPKTVNAYEWQLGVLEADMNRVNPSTNMTPAELEKWKQGTEYGYRNFDWYDFIIQKNSPLTSMNVNATGGSEKINYYLSVTRLDQNSVLGREFTFKRTNVQSNIDAKVSNRFKVGMQINGRIETRDNPGVPGGDDYWAPRFALFRNRPYERPFANDNPEYLNDIGHNAENWGLLNKAKSGYWRQDWRVIQLNFNGEYTTPIKGLTVQGKYSYYLADMVTNGHEYTYDAYTFNPLDSTYKRTGGSDNPWRERIVEKVFNQVAQLQLNYNNSFGLHTVGATLATERIDRRNIRTFQHAVPSINELPNLQFSDMDANQFEDVDRQEARLGYIARVNYSYDNRYYIEFSGRRDASWKFAPGKRVGYFPNVSAGWRITSEKFFDRMTGGNSVLTDLKIRASYGELGDDNVPNLGPFDYIAGYNYNVGRSIFNGNTVLGARNRGVPITNISWFVSTITDVGADFSLLNGALTGTVDYFYRKRTGLRGRKYDVLVPSELGYSLPDENVESDAVLGGEGSLNYIGSIGEVKFNVGGNLSFARRKFLDSYKPVYGNSLDKYNNGRENRWSDIYWGYEVIGQFQSQEQINDYPVNIDNEGNRTLLPGDLIYKDINGDKKIDGNDVRPIGYVANRNPNVNFGFTLGFNFRGIDFTADFSGGSMYTFGQNWEMKWPYQNGGNLLRQFFDSRWHREDPFDVNSKWIPGKYPALRFNQGGHSNYRDGSWQSTFWTTNVKYLRARTIELGYSLPKEWLQRVKLNKVRFYINTYNLFSIDNLKDIGIEPEVMDPNGLQYPQNRFINFGVNLSF